MAPSPTSPQRSLLPRASSGRFEAHLEERPNWAELYDAKDWLAMEEGSPRFLSEGQQRRQFLAFFPVIFPLRHCPPEGLPLFHNIKAVRHLLDKHTAVVWFQLLRKVRSRCAFRRHIRNHIEQQRKEREIVLESWMGYWRTMEMKATVEVRKQIQAPQPAVTTPQQQAKMALRRSFMVTPDGVKTEVLWQLYWLLHAQLNQQIKVHWDRWLALNHQRTELRKSTDDTFRLDFSQGVPQTLRAVNAALFIQELQQPQKRFPTGRVVTFKEMLRLADCFNDLPDWVELQSPASITSAMAGFLTSPLCTDSRWMAARYNQPTPVIPKCSWTPSARYPVSLRLTAPGPLDAVDPLSISCCSSPLTPLIPPLHASPTWNRHSSMSSPTQLCESARCPATSPDARRRSLSTVRSLPSLIVPKARGSLPQGQMRPWMLLPGLLRRPTMESRDLPPRAPESPWGPKPLKAPKGCL
eukprot:GGOE01034985.1.p1 GENE.GGOE01034985.1~~GGOE01034985.1.p1  ORF type:complete len:478 (-),score=119.37 GGOE01034985.1:1346-2746(-)